MGCRSGSDPLSLELRMGRSQKGCCAGTLLPQASLNHVDLIILSPTLKITGPTSIFALCPTAAFAARLYRLGSGWFFLVAGAVVPVLWGLGFELRVQCSGLRVKDLALMENQMEKKRYLGVCSSTLQPYIYGSFPK